MIIRLKRQNLIPVQQTITVCNIDKSTFGRFRLVFTPKYQLSGQYQELTLKNEQECKKKKHSNNKQTDYLYKI